MTRLRKISRRYGVLMIGILLAATLCAYSDPCAYLVKDRVVVPLRFVCDQLQCPIDYDVPTRSASMKWNETAITFTISKNVALVNGKKVKLPSPAQTFDDRLYVPLRFMSDTLGLPLFWSAETQEAVLRIPKDGTAFGQFVRMKLMSPEVETLYDGTQLAQPKEDPALLPGSGETPPAALPGVETAPAPLKADEKVKPDTTAANTPVAPTKVDTMDVIFVGNSLTYVGKMPAIVQALSMENPKRQPLVFDQIGAAGSSLQYHWETPGARRRVIERRWDYVVLQERPDHTIRMFDRMVKAIGLFNDAVSKNGTKTLLFMTWEQRTAPAGSNTIEKAYRAAGTQCGVSVAPVGIAWRDAQRQRKSLDLFDKDGIHANQKGAYLTACVFYSLFYGQSPVGLPGNLREVHPSGKGPILTKINADEARFLQSVAWSAARQGR